MIQLRSGSATDVGRVRHNNQDMALEASNLFGVADGMGGHVGGEVAARTAIEALRRSFDQVKGRPSIRNLVNAVGAANLAVWDRARSDADLRGMGTTLTAMALVSEEDQAEIALVNVGDSRAYRLRNDIFAQLTSDHTLVEEMVRTGELSPTDAASHPKRHVLTRALGIEPDVEVDAWLVRPAVGDRLLLCSDGLINEVPDRAIAQVLRDVPDPAEAAQALVSMALRHGGSDNVTVVVVNVVDEGGDDVDAGGSGASRKWPSSGRPALGSSQPD
ncbi:MAG: Stp1/IreP family PP2C-type Ser/Thr phosphatase [Acidimicrobiales bacterium]